MTGGPSRRAALLGVLGAVWLAGCDRAPKVRATPLAAGSTVLALGDSLTSGTGASPDTAYPAVLAPLLVIEGVLGLARLTGWQVVNAGVSGDTAAQALARLPALLAEHQPKLVIVSVGGNDFLRQLPEEATRANVRALCQQSLAAGAQVLLVAVPRASVAAALGQLTDHKLYAEIAQELKIPLQREGWSEVLAQDDLRSDRIHANARGYEQFARSLRGTAVAVGLLAG